MTLRLGVMPAFRRKARAAHTVTLLDSCSDRRPPTVSRLGGHDVPVTPPHLVSVRPLVPDDGDWARAALVAAWGSVLAARKGEVVDASVLPGFVATIDDAPAGLAVVAVRGPEYEIVSISTMVEGQGIGRALLQHCVDDARALGCRRVWLTTTNDNVRALAFYQRFGMDLCAFYRHGVDEARQLKPSIPLRDAFGVAIAHELELELLLSDDPGNRVREPWTGPA
jgi:ribosomal protein S18 acetylase RimI-like enzyme